MDRRTFLKKAIRTLGGFAFLGFAKWGDSQRAKRASNPKYHARVQMLRRIVKEVPAHNGLLTLRQVEAYEWNGSRYVPLFNSEHSHRAKGSPRG